MPERPLTNLGVAVIGSTTLDEVWISGQRTFKMGGVTTYAGLTYARFGIPTRIVTRVAGHDAWMIRKMHQKGIMTYGNWAGATTVFVNFMEGESREQRILSVANPILKESIDNALDRVDTIHLGPLHPDDIDPMALADLDGERFFIVLDIQGYLRQREGNIVRPAVSRYLMDALRVARIIKGDWEEIALTLAFFNCPLEDLLTQFRIQEAVVTEGYKGGWVQDDQGGFFRFQGEPIFKVSDPTGAGDVFFAAYVTQRRFKGDDIAQASRIAARIAAQQVEGTHIRPETLYPDAD